MNSVTAPVERFVHHYGNLVGKSVMVLVLVCLWAPIALVAVMSFSAGGVLSFPPSGFTTQWYVDFLGNDSAIQSIVTTLQVSLVATPLTVILATVFSYGVSRYEFRGKGISQLAISLPLIVPLVVTGISLTMFFGFLNLGSGYGPVVLSHVVRTLPFAALIILPTFLTFDTRLEEASQDLGATEVETFFKVTIPNTLPGLIAGGLLAFTISFNEFVYTYFVAGTGTETMPLYLWNQIQFSATPEVNVLSVIFLLVAVATVLIAVFFTNVERITTQT